MRSDTTSETERRPTDTNAQVGETETRPTNTNAEVREVGNTETRLTDTNVEVGEVGETETRPTDTNVEVGEVGETETQPRDAKAEVGDTETRLMDTNVEGEVGETETQPTVTNAEVGETEPQPTGTNAEVGEVGDTERRPDLVWDAEAPGLCVRIYGDGSKSFIFVYCLNDRQHFIRIGTTPVWSLEAARNRAKKLRSILNQGDDPVRYHKQNTVAPVENVIRYIAEQLQSTIDPALP